MVEKFSDESVEKDKKLLSYNIVKDSSDKPLIKVSHIGEEKELSLEEISVWF